MAPITDGELADELQAALDAHPLLDDYDDCTACPGRARRSMIVIDETLAAGLHHEGAL